jgi:SulP family sulfate permease
MTLEPKLFQVIREGYTREKFLRDVGAGVIVGIVALPLSIALAIASGVRPEQGLYTAVIAGFLISALGGSRVQIGGPTGAFVVLVFEIVREHGYEGLAICTIMAGGILVLMGLSGLGRVIRFIPYPVTVGFTSGIALLIFSTQVPDAFGFATTEWPDGIIGRWTAYAGHLGEFGAWPTAICAVSILITVYGSRIVRAVPGSLIAIVSTAAAVQLFDLPVETIATKLGAVPSSLPMPHLPTVDWAQLGDLFSPALSIALLAGIESLLSAVVADGMIGGRHRTDMELVAQGVANIASPLFGGIPATGAIARTATNVKSGGRTPVAGMIHALTLLVILVFAGDWAALIPMPALAGILMVVAYNMSERHLFVKIFRSTRSDVAVLLTTFGLTLLADLTMAIQVGVVLASLLFMLRMSETTQAGYITGLNEENGAETDETNGLAAGKIPTGVEIFEINGPFFFGAADRFKDALREVARKPKVLILRMRHVPVMDSTGLRALEDVVGKTLREGSVVILSGLQPQPRVLLERSGLLERIGTGNDAPDIQQALEIARKLLGERTAGS